MDEQLKKLAELAQKEYSLTPEEARLMIKLASDVTRYYLINAGYDARSVLRLTTKLRDAGRRSPPWNAFSKRVPGRPQDGSDGNRRLRWLFESTHKFYADEITATLVEVKYYLQILSMNNAPALPDQSIQNKFIWLTGHQILPGAYLDPIQMIPIDLKVIISDLRNIHSGHLIPLDRGGKHEPKNAFLVLSRSNQLQGNLTLEELLVLMADILAKHNAVTGKKLVES